MRLRKLAALVVLFGLGCLLILPANAAVVHYRAEGTVTSVDSNNGLLPIVGNVGDTIVFEFSFDTDAADTNGFVSQGYYPALAMTVTVGANAPVAVTSPEIRIQSAPITNLWGIQGCLPSCANATYDEVRLNFFLPSGSVLTDALTLPPYPPPSGTTVQFGLFSANFDVGQQDSINASLGVLSAPLSDPPVADAGPDLIAAVGERVAISGLLSSDDETPVLALQYTWRIESAPSGSTAILEDGDTAVASLSADIPGSYIISLVVRDDDNLVSEAAYVSVEAEIDPAFVYERLASGGWTNRDGLNSYEYSADYFNPYGLTGGRLYGQGWQYSYGYDWTSGSYTSEYHPRLSWLDSAGEDRLLERGDPMPGSDGATFHYFWLHRRAGTALEFDGYGFNAPGAYSFGRFQVGSDGVVTPRPSGPFPIEGEDDSLQYVWSNWSDTDADLVYGSKGTYMTRERTVSYSCGANGLDTCTRMYTDYVWHYGIYLLDGSEAELIADTDTTVPGESMPFRGFGTATGDETNGGVAFVGHWVDSAGRWHQGIFKKTSLGSIVSVVDDRDSLLTGGYFGRLAADGGKLYFGAHAYSSSSYGSGAGGSSWWSAWRSGIYSVDEGPPKPEMEGGGGWFQRSNAGLYETSYGYSAPDYWNFAVDQGILAFGAHTYVYTYDSSTQNYTYSYDQGTFWKENGQLRAIARSGDTLAGTQYQYVWSPCCYGDWLDGRSAALVAQNSTWTHDSLSGETVSTGIIDTILARFDSDRDGRGDDVDNCPLRPNPDQLDSDANGVGDPCEDTDLDGWQDAVDNCPVVGNDQSNVDNDVPGDACDVCPFVADDQSDQDGDGIGDACDTDADNDTIADNVDNCPNAPNTDQANLDTDLFGDACDPDIDGDGIANPVDGLWNGQNYVDESLTFSSNFADHILGGRSFGRISSRGQLIVLVEDAPDSERGQLISAVNGSGHGMLKQCDFNGKDASIRLEQGSVVTVTCGSLSVHALARGAQVLLDDDVLIDVQQQAEVRIVGLGEGEFRVENAGEAQLPVVVNLGEDVEVTIPTAAATEISEPAPGEYVVENVAESPQPIAVTVDGTTTEIEPGETEEVEDLRDVTPPVIAPAISGALGNDDWYTSDVQVSWGVEDPQSGVTSTTGCDTTAIVSDTSSTVLTCTASSAGGTASHSVTIKRDATPPQVAIGVPADGAVYTLNQVVTADYSCTDVMSGLGSCVGAVPEGSAIDTATVGTKEFTATGTDGAGNAATVGHDYSVRYEFIGFQQPVDNPPVTNVVSAGKTVPVKWQLKDAAGVLISSVASFRSLGSIAASCDAGAPLDSIEELVTSGGTTLRYDEVENQFVYNWATAASWKGKCRKLLLELADGQKKEALFKFK